MGKKDKKASIAMIVSALVIVASIVGERYGITVDDTTIQLFVGGVMGLFGLSIAGHTMTNMSAIKNGKEKQDESK